MDAGGRTRPSDHSAAGLFLDPRRAYATLPLPARLRRRAAAGPSRSAARPHANLAALRRPGSRALRDRQLPTALSPHYLARRIAAWGRSAGRPCDIAGGGVRGGGRTVAAGPRTKNQ